MSESVSCVIHTGPHGNEDTYPTLIICTTVSLEFKGQTPDYMV